MSMQFPTTMNGVEFRVTRYCYGIETWLILLWDWDVADILSLHKEVEW